MPVIELQGRNPASFRDPCGFVFEAGGRVFRAVDQTCFDIVTELNQKGLLAELAEAGLIVRTQIVDDPVLASELTGAYPGFPAFLEHERIHPISYPHEWSASMLADAGIATLELQMRLLEHGYSLKDATAYNIQFAGGRPVFIDIASIERPERLDVWIALGQFGRMFTLPLLLHRRKGHSLRSYFLANLDGSDVAEVQRAFGRLELLRPGLLLDVTLPYWLGRAANGRADAAPQRIGRKETSPTAQILNLRRLRSKLARLARPGRPDGPWTGYAESSSYSDRAEASKVDAVRAFLREFQPGSVLDIGCNTGRHSMLAAESGAGVVSVDRDPDCIDILYRQVRGGRRSILPMCVDIANSSPAIGFRNRERPSFLDRIHAECVFALALVHHLHVSANLPLAAIRDLFGDLTEKYLVLEFIPTDDAMFRRLTRFRRDLYEDFTLENFLAAFRERFDLIRKIPVQDAPRTLLIWKKKHQTGTSEPGAESFS